MSSICFSFIYHKRVTMNNGMDINSDLPVESPALSYEEEQEKELHLRKVAETTNNMRLQGKNNEASLIQAKHGDHAFSNNSCSKASCNNDNNIISIQLPYDPNTPMESDLWSGNFHPISLHGSMEQIASDTKSIKDLLNFMAKYISNKKVNLKTANNFKDFDGIGDAVWNFISSVYQLG